MGLFEDDKIVRAKKPKGKRIQAISLPPSGASFDTIDIVAMSEKTVASGIIIPKIDYVNDEPNKV